jgi:hypothetical protein
MHFPLARPKLAGVGRLGYESGNGRVRVVLRNRLCLGRPLLAGLFGAAIAVAVASIAPPAALLLALALTGRRGFGVARPLLLRLLRLLG